MGALDYDALFRRLKKGAVDPVYYLYGDEDVLKQEALHLLLERALDGAMRDFNLDQREAAGLDAQDLQTLVQTLPMMAERRVVVLRGVEQLRKKSRARDAVLRYLESPNPETVLVLVQSAGEEREADLASHATEVALDRLPADRAPRWLHHRASQLGLTLDPEAADLLLVAVDQDLGLAARELEKLLPLVQGRAVTPEDLAAVAGVRRGETVPDLVAAVLSRETPRAAALIAPVLEQSGVTGVRIVSALGTALVGTALARAELDRGTSPARLKDVMYNHIQQARPPGLGSWRDTAARWSQSAGPWSAAELRHALALTLAADQALKTTTVSDELAIVTDLVVRLALPSAVAA
jgi:DNA polymerase-3 subunit delta